MVVAPAYAQGLALVGRALSPVLENAPGTRYVVDGGRLLAQRPTWFAQQNRTAPLAWPIWVASANYGVPLLAALVLATPGWGWRRRGRVIALGLGLITVTQIAFVLVTIVATQQSPVMSPSGLVAVPGFSATKQSISYALYYFFDLTGRGFFALLIYLGLIAGYWKAPAAARPVSGGSPVGRNDLCSCGSGRKYKRCCLA